MDVACYDSEMTARLWLATLERIKQQYALSPNDFGHIQILARVPGHLAERFWDRVRKPSERIDMFTRQKAEDHGRSQGGSGARIGG